MRKATHRSSISLAICKKHAPNAVLSQNNGETAMAHAPEDVHLDLTIWRDEFYDLRTKIRIGEICLKSGIGRIRNEVPLRNVSETNSPGLSTIERSLNCVVGITPHTGGRA